MTLRSVLILYGVVLVVLSLVSLNRYILVSYCRRARRRRAGGTPELALMPSPPRVTIQLPIYNEYYVAERIIRSACAVTYPRDRLQIQVLDDSTDGTIELTRALVARYSEEGVDIVLVHRTDRTGFKGGALRNALRGATGDLVAIFDADFVIPPDFLERTVPHFADESVGIVQARWTYLNEAYSALTRGAVIGLDAQFAIEQVGRDEGGLFLGFNGTGALLRRKAIEAAGGWEDDTITEDLDLSYRAQLAGYRIKYLFDVTCDSELPVDIHGLKAQQFRWTKGTQETAKKLIPRVMHAPIAGWLKLQGLLHLLSNATYPFLLLAGILNPLVVYAAHHSNIRLAWPISAYFLFSLFGTYSYHIEAERMLHERWTKRIRNIIYFLALSIGMSVNNSQAVVEAWLGKKSPFIRTPKYRIVERGESWTRKRYRAPVSWTAVGEIVMALWTFAGLAYAIVTREYGATPFLVLFGTGYALVAAYSIRHHVAVRHAVHPVIDPDARAVITRPAA